MGTHCVFLGLGSNLGNRKRHILRAVRLIGERVGVVQRQSSLYETEPWGFESNNHFVNAVVKVQTPLLPREVLQATQQIEREMGRRHKSQVASDGISPVYQDRVIDIDILLYDELHVDEPDLKIPHPLMYQRDFVTKPLEEIMRETAESMRR